MGLNIFKILTTVTTGFWEWWKLVHIYDIYCNGTKRKILKCPPNTINTPQYYSNDASVQCQGTKYSNKCIYIVFY